MKLTCLPIAQNNRLISRTTDEFCFGLTDFRKAIICFTKIYKYIRLFSRIISKFYIEHNFYVEYLFKYTSIIIFFNTYHFQFVKILSILSEEKSPCQLI